MGVDSVGHGKEVKEEEERPLGLMTHKAVQDSSAVGLWNQRPQA